MWSSSVIILLLSPLQVVTQAAITSLPVLLKDEPSELKFEAAQAQARMAEQAQPMIGDSQPNLIMSDGIQEDTMSEVLKAIKLVY